MSLHSYSKNGTNSFLSSNGLMSTFEKQKKEIYCNYYKKSKLGLCWLVHLPDIKMVRTRLILQVNNYHPVLCSF